MKNSLASILFFLFCFVMVFNSCDLDVAPNVPPDVTLYFDARLMSPGKTYEFEVRGEDPDGDSLTYSWSVEGSSSGFLKNKGRFSSTTKRVVSYTAPDITLSHGIPAYSGGRSYASLLLKVIVSDGSYEVSLSIDLDLYYSDATIPEYFVWRIS